MVALLQRQKPWFEWHGQQEEDAREEFTQNSLLPASAEAAVASALCTRFPARARVHICEMVRIRWETNCDVRQS